MFSIVVTLVCGSVDVFPFRPEAQKATSESGQQTDNPVISPYAQPIDIVLLFGVIIILS